MTLAAGLLLAGFSAAVSQVGLLLRHRGAVDARDVDMHRPLRSAIDLFRSKWWTIGYALAVVAYLLHVGALTLTSLSLVQVVLAGGIVLLAVIAERFFGFELGRRQWFAWCWRQLAWRCSRSWESRGRARAPPTTRLPRWSPSRPLWWAPERH